MDMNDSGWRKRQIALDKKAENARELGLDYEPSIIEMAREAQLPYFYQTGEIANLKQLEAFAAMVREDEREACAKLAAKTVCDVHIPTGVKIYGTVAAKAIRARGQA